MHLLPLDIFINKRMYLSNVTRAQNSCYRPHNPYFLFLDFFSLLVGAGVCPRREQGLWVQPVSPRPAHAAVELLGPSVAAPRGLSQLAHQTEHFGTEAL